MEQLARTDRRCRRDPAEAAAPLADPKDKWEILERYRAAAGPRGASGNGPTRSRCFSASCATSPTSPRSGTSWPASRCWLNRYDVALDAYRHIIGLEPAEPHGYLGAAEVLLKERRLDDARARATGGGGRCRRTRTPASRAAAHALLARIALARRDLDAAREEAALAAEADPGLPMPAVRRRTDSLRPGKVRGRAGSEFEKAVAAGGKPGATPIAELHFYAGDTLARLDRQADAEAEFVNELRLLPAERPRQGRARDALSRQRTGRRRGHRHHRHAARRPHAGVLRARRAPVEVVRQAAPGRGDPRRSPAHVCRAAPINNDQRRTAETAESCVSRVCEFCALRFLTSVRAARAPEP